jgi:hypothetical protein
MWDMLYANELGHLCQSIGTGTTPNTKQVAKTKTFFLIDYNDIPVHKREEICHTLVVRKVRPEKDDPDCTQITIGGSQICYPWDVGCQETQQEIQLINVLQNYVLLLCMYSWMVGACDVSLLYSWLAKYSVTGKLRGDSQTAYAW